MIQDYLTIAEMAKAKSVGQKTIRRWIADHNIEKHRINPKNPNQVYIRKSDADRYVKFRGIKPVAEEKENDHIDTPVAPENISIETKNVQQNKPMSKADDHVHDQVSNHVHTLNVQWSKPKSIAWFFVLIPSIVVAFFVGNYSPTLFGFQASVFFGVLWSAMLCLINVSFFLIKEISLAAKSFRIILLLCSSILGVQVIDSILFQDTIVELNNAQSSAEQIASLPHIVVLQQRVDQRQQQYDNSTAIFQEEITTRGGYGKNAQALEKAITKDSLELFLARAQLENALISERQSMQEKEKTTNWLLDIISFHQFVFSNPYALVIYILTFAVILILELLPILLIPKH